MASITLRIRDDIAKEFREFAVKKTGSMRGLSRVAEAALAEYLERHKDEVKK